MEDSITTDWRQSVAITAFIPPNIVYKIAIVFSIIRLKVRYEPEFFENFMI